MDDGPRSGDVDSDGSRVTLTSFDDDVTFHLLTGTTQGTFLGASTSGNFIGGAVAADNYQVLCTAPCEAKLPDGMHRLALSTGTGRPIAVDDPVQVSGRTTIRGHYVSHSAIRWTGAGMAVAGLGGLLLWAATAPDCNADTGDNCTVSTGEYLAMAALGGLAITGVFMVFLVKDSAELSVEPGVALSSPTPRFARREMGPAALQAPGGLTATLRF
jgi:hypothetical protein